MECEQNRTAEITHREAERRHEIEMLRPRHIDEQRIIKDGRTVKTDRRQDIQAQRPRPVALGDEAERRGHRRTDHGEHDQETLTKSARIGDGAEHRRSNGDEEVRNRRNPREPRGNGRTAGPGAPVTAEKQRVKHGHDAQRKR